MRNLDQRRNQLKERVSTRWGADHEAASVLRTNGALVNLP